MKRSQASKNLKDLEQNPSQEIQAEAQAVAPTLPRTTSVVQNLNENFGVFSYLRRSQAFQAQLNTLGTTVEAARPYKR